MGVVITLVAAGLRRRPASLLLTLVVIAVAAAGITASSAVRGRAADTVDAAFERANGPDLIAVTDADTVAELHAVLAERDDVVRVAEPVPTVDAQTTLAGDRVESDLRTISEPTAAVNAPVVTAGRVPTSAGEALLDAGVALDTGAHAGDTIDVSVDGRSTTLQVVGLAYDFTDCFYPTCDPGHVWVQPSTFDAAVGTADPSMLTAIDLVDPDAAAAVWNALDDALRERLRGGNDWLDTRGDLLVENQFFGAFLGAFGMFVMVGSAIVIGATITARTASRRRSLAICKAAGCTDAQVTAALLIEQLTLAAVATSIGWMAGTLITPRMRIGALRVLDGDGANWSPALLGVVLTLVSGIVLVTTLVPAWRAGRVDVVDAIADRPSSGTRASRTGTMRRPVPVAVELGCRSSSARPVRTLLAASGVALAVVAVVITIGIGRSVDRIVDQPALAGDPYDAVVTPFTVGDTVAVERALSDAGGIGGWYTFADDRAVVDGTNIHVRGIGGELSEAGYVIGQGRSLRGPGDAIAGYGAIKSNGWQLGDELTVEVDGTTFPVQLVGWYRETEDSGQIVQITLDDLQRARSEAVAASFAVSADRSTTPTMLGRSLSAAVGDVAMVAVNETDAAQMRPFRIAMSTMTLLLGVIVLAHLAAMSLTAARQRRHRTAVLHSMGLGRAALAVEAAVHGAIVGVLGVLVGLAVGWPARRLVGDVLTGALGAGPGLTLAPTGSQMLLVSGVAIVASAVIAAAVGVQSRGQTVPGS